MAVLNGTAGASAIAGAWDAVQLAHEPRPRRPDRSRWHVLPASRVVDQLRTDPVAGLAADEVVQRRSAQRSTASDVSPLEPFLAELANPLNPILGVGAALSAASGSMADASLVLGLIGVNTAVGGVQRLRADRAVRRLLTGTVEQVTVVRDGRTVRVGEDELVPGDVIQLVAGEPVPADARIVAADGCEVDESTLTGESLPVVKVADAVGEAELAERACMLYEDTTVVTGSVRAVVVATGAATQVARSLALAGPPPRTGVELRLEELTRRLQPGALTVAAGTGLVGLLRRWPGTEVAGTAVSLAIASVPEGLPFVATAGQLAGARRLAASGAVVRNPRTVEALGRVDVLCVDKTGTLTEGRVAVTALSDGAAEHPVGDLDDTSRLVLAAAALASDQPGTNGRRLADLDDADRALHAAVATTGLDPVTTVGGWEQLDDLPFEASRGVHAVLGAQDGGRRVLVKGAPETLLDACTTWRRPDGTVAFDAARRAEVDAHLEELARRGHRLLAVATGDAGRRQAEVDEPDLEELELLGLVVLADPVRPTAAAAVRGIADAGVRTVMVTGDHPETAASIADQLGLDTRAQVLTGTEVEALDDDQLAARLAETSVVARVTPAHKQRVVQVLQDAGHVVAMTGDGANDAAAIRLAQVGVALGERSSGAAREAADIVVTDDRVETLIDAIAEGRALWGSIREALSVLVGGNLGEIGFTAFASAFSRSAPLHPRQFLLVNLFTDLAPAVAIAVRPPEDTTAATLLREGPDRSLGASLRRDIAIRGTATALGAAGAWSAARLTGTPARAGTVGLAALVGTQLGQTLLAGGWRRPSTLVTVAGSAVVFVGAVQTPIVSRFFGSRPLGPLGWSQALTASAVATVGSEVAARAAARLDADTADTDGTGDAGDDRPTLPRRRAPVLQVREPAPPVALVGGGRLATALRDRLARAGHDAAVVDDDTGRSEELTGQLAGRPVLLDLGGRADRAGEAAVTASEQRAARLADAADLAGVARILHLGPLVDDAALHRARPAAYRAAAAAAALRAGPVPVTELRSGPLLGTRDRTFRLLRAVARLPLALDHPLLSRRLQPVAVDDLLAVLADLAGQPGAAPRRLDLGGPEVVTVEALVEQVRSREGFARLLRPPVRRLPPETLAPALARTGHLDLASVHALLHLTDVAATVEDPASRRPYPQLLATPPAQALAQVWA